MQDIMKMVRFLEESGLLIKVVKETIENEAKEQRGRFLFVIRNIKVIWRAILGPFPQNVGKNGFYWNKC